MAEIGEEGHSSQLQLTDLPDEIIIRILSMLPTTQDAVRTCLLLFRNGQQHLWKSLTSLKFLGDRFVFTSNDHLMNFVDRVMRLRDNSVTLVSFSLKSKVRGYNYPVITWITNAVQCNVQHLTLSIFDYDIYYDMKCCIFGCQSLVKLDLEFIIFDVPSSVVSLPHLKYLRLRKVELQGDESTEKLFSAPLLEELIIDQCIWYWIESIRVCSLKLQVLKIWDGPLYGSYHSAKLSITGDNLKYFSYAGNLNNVYWICASSSTQLAKVEILVEEKMFGDLCLNCYDILKGLYGTRNLTLSDYFLEGLQNISELLDTVQVFECLTRLDILVYKKEVSIDSLALMKIYEKCPHLEYLTIGKLSNTTRNLQWSPVPLCFQTSLKKILVHCYVPGENKADTAIEVLLNNALVLEELIIYCLRDKANSFHEGSRKIQELQDRFNQRPRVSKHCIISIRVNCY